MANTINATSTGAGGLITTGDDSGVLNIQTNETTAISIDASQAVSFTNAPTVTGGTANGVAYLNGSKVLTTGSALVFDGTNLGLGVTPSTTTFSGSKMLQLGSVGSVLQGVTSAYYAMIQGAFFNSAGNWQSTGSGYRITQYAQGDGSHTWYTAPVTTAGASVTYTRAMDIDPNGRLLVGTTSNSNSVRFKVAADGTNINSEFYQPSASSYTCIVFTNPSGTAGSITTLALTTSYGTTSDYRLKENVAPMVGALDTIAQLKPVTYKWKVDGSAGQGFIAHELQSVVPDCVTGEKDAVETQQYEISPAVPATFDEDGNELTPAVEAVMGEREVPKYQGIDTSFLVATLTAAIQEQQALITQLQADVAALKGA